MKVKTQQELENLSTDENVQLTDDIYIKDSLTTIKKFTGCLDGNGHTIYDLTTCFIGILEGELKNIQFKNINVTGDFDGVVRENDGLIKSVQVRESNIECREKNTQVGVLNIENRSNIENCRVSDTTMYCRNDSGGITAINGGNIIDCTITNYTGSGKLAGSITGVNKSYIQDCNVENCVISGLSGAGGVCGSSKNNTEISSTTVCRSSIENAVYIGGITAESEETTISNCELDSNSLMGRLGVGGFVGYVKDTTIIRSEIYNTGIEAVGSNTNPGIAVGKINVDSSRGSPEVFVRECFGENIDITCESIEVFSGHSIFNSEFEAHITIYDTIDFDYDRSESDSQIVWDKISKKGSLQEIYTEEDLEEIHPYDTVVLQNDITITKDLDIIKTFYGVFKGNNHTISGLTTALFEYLHGDVLNLEVTDLTYTTDVFCPSFGWIAKQSDGTITNVTITTEVNSMIKSDIYGSIVGSLRKGRIEDCTVSGSVTAVHVIGGIAAQIKTATISNCTVNLSIRGHSGGLVVSECTNSKICACESTGEIVCRQRSAGIAGIIYKEIFPNNPRSGSTLSKLKSNATIQSEELSGGIIGVTKSEDATITSCYFDGVVTGSVSGGIVSENICAISNCTTDAEISGDSVAGGICGITLNDIKSCTTKGEVRSIDTKNSKRSGFGGTVGRVEDSISIINCKNYSDIDIQSKNIGGFVGSVSNSTTIEKCSNHGSLRGNSNIGGLIGKTSSEISLSSSYNTGTIQGEHNTDHIVGNGCKNIIKSIHVYWIPNSRTDTTACVGEKFEDTEEKLRVLLEI